jgi:hypothetical protein
VGIEKLLINIEKAAPNILAFCPRFGWVCPESGTNLLDGELNLKIKKLSGLFLGEARSILKLVFQKYFGTRGAFYTIAVLRLIAPATLT